MAKGYKRANGTGGVTKLSGRRTRPYLARVCTGNKLSADGTSAYCTYYNVGYYKTRAEAVKALEEFNGLNAKIEVIDYTLEDVYNYFLAHDSKLLSESSRHNNKTAYKHLKSLYKVKYRSISVAMVDEIMQDMTCNPQIQIKRLFGLLDKTARKLDMPIKTISELITSKAYEKKFDKQPLSEDQIADLWTKVDNDYAKIILILVYTGWRITELKSLTKESVNLEDKTMQGGIKTKAGKNRIVPIHERILPLVKYFYEKSEDTIIPKALSMERALIDNFTALTGRKLTPHECRHTMETRLSNVGVDLVIRNKIMGHSNKNIGDDVYNHKTLEQLREAINKLL